MSLNTPAKIGQPLTQSMRSVVRLYCYGWSVHEIATHLLISDDTVKTQLRDAKFRWSGGGMSRREVYHQARIEGIIK